jgi:N-acetylmuramoyl-L-alanine amidase
MYDFLISLLETIFRHGWSLSSAGAIVFLLLKQRKIKKRLKKYFPWMFAEENDVRAYATNQLIILENQKRIMITLGVEPCANGLITKSNEVEAKNLNLLSGLLQAVTRLVNRLRRNKMKTIVIDAGHGGKDPGAVGTTGACEKDFALTMALKLEARLLGSEVTAILTRKTDTYLELSQRAKIANDLKVDGFISIHANSSTSQASGTETLYTRPDSQKFAEILNKHMVNATGLKDRGVKYKNLAVTRETKMPASLLEVGFINHPGDEIKLLDTTFQDKVVEALAKAIFEYFGAADRPSKNEVIDHPYPVMNVLVHAHEDQSFTGYNIKNLTWIPSRPVGELLGAEIGYKKGKVLINGTAVETQLVNGLGYVKARDLTDQLGARVFWDKSNPKQVEIFKGA